MDKTPVSLLERLRQPTEQEAWPRFLQLFTPLLYHWAGRLGAQDQDATDLVQEVLLVLIQKLPTFQYDSAKSFRGWLRTILVNKWRDQQRRRTAAPVEEHQSLIDELTSPDHAAEVDEAEYRQHLVHRAMQLMQADFQPTTWRACWEHVVNDKPAATVATELGVSVAVVYAAKSRVLRRLRQELEGMLT